MNNLATTIKQMAAQGHINVEQLIMMASQQDEIITAARPVLDKCYTQVGLVLGEDIRAITSKMDGRRFDPKEFHYEKPIDGQE